MPLTIAIAGLVAISGMLLWGSVRRMHDRFEKMVFGIFDREEPVSREEVKATHDELIRLIREDYPWEVATEDFLVPWKESGIHRSLRELHLRSATGTSVIAIYRGDDLIPNPPPETRIQPGDVLLLMGDPAQIRQGVRFLQERMKEPPPAREGESRLETRRFEIPPGSPLAGQTLKSVGLRSHTRITVLSIQKGRDVIHNPDAGVLLAAGDGLMLFGMKAQIDQAVEYLRHWHPSL